MNHKISSYQRRKREIEFYKRRGEQLEEIIEAILTINNISTIPLTGTGIKEDDAINDIDSGDFAFRILCKIRNKKGANNSDSQEV